MKTEDISPPQIDTGLLKLLERQAQLRQIMCGDAKPSKQRATAARELKRLNRELMVQVQINLDGSKPDREDCLHRHIQILESECLRLREELVHNGFCYLRESDLTAIRDALRNYAATLDKIGDELIEDVGK